MDLELVCDFIYLPETGLQLAVFGSHWQSLVVMTELRISDFLGLFRLLLGSMDLHS